MKTTVSLRTRFVIIQQAEDFVIGSFSRCLRAADSEIDGNSNIGSFSGIGNGAPAESVENTLGLLHCFARRTQEGWPFQLVLRRNLCLFEGQGENFGFDVFLLPTLFFLPAL